MFIRPSLLLCFFFLIHCAKSGEATCAAPTSLELNFDTATMTSNLNGLGPDSGEPVIKFDNIGTFQGEPITVVYSVRDGVCDVFNIDGNIPVGDLFKMNLQVGGECRVTMSFTNGNTGAAITLPDFYITYVDIDGQSGQSQIIMESPYTSVIPGANVGSANAVNGFPRWKNNKALGNVENVEQKDEMSNAQKKASIAFYYENISTIDYTLRATNPDGNGLAAKGKNFFMSGVSSAIVDLCPAYNIGAWSECATNSGDCVKTRTVTCNYINEQECIDESLTKDAESETCAANECAGAPQTTLRPDHVGCYVDVENRVFNHEEEVVVANTLWTADTCIAACAGFAHAGVEYNAAECFCGLDIENVDEYGASTDCVDGLGARWAIDVYTVPDATRVYAYETNYDDNAVGCYTDKNGKDRIFKQKYVSLVGKSVADCDTECKNDGAAFFGIEYDVQCFCGATGADYTVYGASDDCRENGRGGEWAMNVYNVSP